jgi:hypothetical protein
MVQERAWRHLALLWTYRSAQTRQKRPLSFAFIDRKTENAIWHRIAVLAEPQVSEVGLHFQFTDQ